MALGLSSEATAARAGRRVRHARQPVRRDGRPDADVRAFRFLGPEPVADDHRPVRFPDYRNDPFFTGGPEEEEHVFEALGSVSRSCVSLGKVSWGNQGSKSPLYHRMFPRC